MIVSSLTVGPFEENCYLIVDDSSGEAVLVDPGDEGERLLAFVADSGARLTAIWVTHAHVDHVGAIAAVKRVHDVPIYLHALDLPLYRAAGRQAAMYGIPFDDPPVPDREWTDGDEVRAGSIAFRVMHAPGHAPGHVVLHQQEVAFVGDCLFAGSIGRTDLPLADPVAMQASLERIAALPRDTVVYPGHGPSTSIGAERSTNPFLTGAARVVRG